MDEIEKGGRDGEMLQTFYGSVIASTVSRILLYPLDTIKVNKQVHTNSRMHIGSSSSGSNGDSHKGKATMKNERPFFLFSFINKYGIKGLYNGFSSLTTIPATSLYFCCFQYLKLKSTLFDEKLTEEKKNYEQSNFVKFRSYFSIALLAEAISCVVFVPIDVIKERLQAQKYLKLKEYCKSYHLAKELVNREGLFRVGKELMKKLEVEPSYFNTFKLNLICSFLSGLITSPLEVVRIRFQLQERNRTSFYYNNSFDGIKKLWREEGGSFLNLFKGNLYRCSLVCLSMTINVTILDMYKKIVCSSHEKGGHTTNTNN
ncbi:mitochondrial carrier protein, putative [Plasmodium ovale wallikeri]|uniref:Mitochondrial carrier protein, putative n=1 Tax=Plasmodium ovale wallikeri TaxID=864142 RepID=A0A1A8YHA4_PLAOA|nr:mitochondrial carrier protein, putative [Plasmodium ovale wallikeri]SBT31262.1 mitochondrial carrier protein, putative [Plasmodium ovale wallikeri]